MTIVQICADMYKELVSGHLDKISWTEQTMPGWKPTVATVTELVQSALKSFCMFPRQQL